MATQIFREGMTPPVDDDMGSMTKYLKKDKPSKIKSIDDIPPLPNAKPRTPEQSKKDMDKAQQDWNKSERKLPSGTLGDNIRNLKKGGKVKKYADGGMTQQPTYPFYGNTPQAGGQNGGMNQTFNMQPQATADNGQMQQPKMFKKGGKVTASKMGAVKVAKPKMSSASSRADGIAIRGKTRA
jgi:hypothetical protein